MTNLTKNSIFQNEKIRTGGILLLVATVASLIGGSGFIGWPLNASEMDYLLFPTILENRTLFEGSVYLPLAEQVSKLSILPWFSGILAEWGLSPTEQITLFFTMEKFLYSIGLLSICYTISKNIRATVICFLIFVVSGFSWIFYLKLVTSGLAVSVGFCIIALALSRHFYLAAALSGLLGYFHPTYLVIYFGLVLAIQLYVIRREKVMSFSSIWKSAFIGIAIATPYAVNIIVNSDNVFGSIPDVNLWFSYMQSRSDLAFPWKQGLPRLMSFLLTFAIAAWLFLIQAKIQGKAVYGRAAVIIMVCIASYPIQIFFTEVIPLAFIAKLALTHRFNFIVQPLLILGTLLIAYNGIKGEHRLSWLFLMLFLATNLVFPQGSIVSKYLPNAHDTSLNLLVFVLVATYITLSSHSTHREHSNSQHRFIGRIAFLLISLNLVLFVNPSFALPLGSLLMVMTWKEPTVWKRLKIKLENLTSRTCYVFVLIMLSLLFLYKINLLQPIRAWSAFFQNNTQTLNNKEKQYIDFVVNHVKADEQILIVPLRDSGKWAPVPYRASYLDWYEINYALYVWDMMPVLIEKVQSYGIDLFAAQAGNECAGWKGLLQYRCQRFILDSNAKNEEYGWRSHVNDILRISPKVHWVFMPKTLSCKNDQVIANFEEYVLVDINKIDPSCGLQRIGAEL